MPAETAAAEPPEEPRQPDIEVVRVARRPVVTVWSKNEGISSMLSAPTKRPAGREPLDQNRRARRGGRQRRCANLRRSEGRP